MWMSRWAHTDQKVMGENNNSRSDLFFLYLLTTAWGCTICTPFLIRKRQWEGNVLPRLKEWYLIIPPSIRLAAHFITLISFLWDLMYKSTFLECCMFLLRFYDWQLLYNLFFCVIPQITCRTSVVPWIIQQTLQQICHTPVSDMLEVVISNWQFIYHNL